VFNQLHAAILDGALEPGEILHDDQLSAWLGASRTPIREALARLAAVGLVESEANKYTRVSPLDAQQLLDSSVAYGWIAAYCARKTFGTLNDAQITALQDANDALQATEPHDMSNLSQRMATFFELFIGFSGNALLISAHRDLSGIIRRFITSSQSPVEDRAFKEQIATLASAAERRNPREGGEIISRLAPTVRSRFQNETIPMSPPAPPSLSRR